MMKKILVPTDFSENSKFGVQYAMQWATSQNLHLVFIHILFVNKPMDWSDELYNEFAKSEEKNHLDQLQQFVSDNYAALNIIPGPHSFEIIQGISADINIIEYCKQNPIDCICISTMGAGSFKKILGTNTGNLITNSKVPVLAIPQQVAFKNIDTILYPTDYKNFNSELEKIIHFIQSDQTTIDILHFTWPDDANENSIMEEAARKQYPNPIEFRYEPNDGIHSLVENVQNQIKIFSPTMVVMFTNQDRTFFQKIFLSSKTEELSFQINIPLLVFKKTIE